MQCSSNILYNVNREARRKGETAKLFHSHLSVAQQMKQESSIQSSSHARVLSHHCSALPQTGHGTKTPAGLDTRE